MKRAEILARLDAAIRNRDPRLADQLRPGLSPNVITKRLRRISGATEPLFELYGWHDGTEPLRWSEGDTHKMSLMELSFFPGEIYHFADLERTVTTLAGFEELTKYHPMFREAVGRYFPLFWDGSRSWLTLDLNPAKNSRIVFFELEDDSPFQEAYATLDEFLLDALHANETGEPLRFFEEGLRG